MRRCRHKGRWWRAAFRYGEHFVARLGHQHGMLPLGRQRVVLGHDGPAVAHLTDVAPAQVDHRLDREGHAGFEFFERARLAVMQHLRFFMKYLADAVAAELAHDREAVALGKLLDGPADVAQARARLDHHDAMPHGLIGHGAQAPGRDRALARDEHAAGVAVPAVLDDGHVDVDDVRLLERLVVRDAVADLVVDRGADRLGVGRVARRLVVQRRRNGALHLGDVVIRQLVQFIRGDADLYVRGQVVQQFGSQSSGNAHAANAFLVFVGDAHGPNYPTG